MEDSGPDGPIYHSKPRTFSALDTIASLIGAIIGGLVVVASWKLISRVHPDQSSYGFGLFCAVPFFCGAITGAISTWKGPTANSVSWLSALLLHGICCTGLLMFGFEGVICIIMASPLTYPIMVCGIFAAGACCNAFRSKTRIFSSMLPLVAGAGVGTIFYNPGFVSKTESTTIIVDAPPEKIWPYLFELSQLPPPEQIIFKTGIAYTLGTHSEGAKVGSRRQCVLSTGVMNETISAIEPNRYLRFEMLNTPPSMKEFNPFYEIHPRHETECFKVRWGEFKLEPLPGGRTRFIGTSNYSYNIYPAWYWGLYTDTVAEQIHVRMMNEIKRRVETR